MGLFSSSTKTIVSSSLFNLAGETGKGREVIPSIIMSSVLSGRNQSLGESIVGVLQGSTAMSQIQFFRWARNFYGLGMPTGSLGAELSAADPNLQTTLEALIPMAPGEKLQLLSARVDDPDIHYWAEAWVQENHPEFGEEDWSAEFDPSVPEIVITYLLDPNIGVLVRLPADANLIWGLGERGRKLLFVSYRILTPDGSGLFVTGPRTLFTQPIGAGNVVIDQLFPDTSPVSEFFPPIPLRLDNVSIRDAAHQADFPTVKKAFRKLTGSSIEDLLDQVEEHQDIDAMDHVFVVPGVPLKTTNKAAKKYLYEFFKGMIPLQLSNLTAEELQLSALVRAKDAATMERWIQANGIGASLFNPMNGTAYPALMTALMARESANELRIAMPNLPEFDFRLRWIGIVETQHVGNSARFDGDQVRPLAKRGDYWISELPDIQPQAASGSLFLAHQISNRKRIAIFHQHDRRRYRKLEIIGLEHRNFVYNDKMVALDATSALTGEDDESFLVPLHYPTLRNVGLPTAAELAQASTYMVVNSFQIVKKKWWQTGFFAAILVIVGIAVSVVTAGTSLGATAGILGTNAAVGAAVGATAATAALVGAVVNGIAAAAITAIISKVSIKVLGEKWGAVIATIVTFLAFQVGSQFVESGNFNVDWSHVFRADNLLKLTDAVSGAYTRWLAADTAGIYAELEGLSEEYQEQVKEIERLSQDILGMTNSVFDPILLTDANEQFGESSEAFLGRTLLTGSDIADLSHAMIEGFAELSLELPAFP